MSLPAASAGSSTPQCAVIGGPGQTGQDSLAALSQTVKTKSITGASGPANSCQLFERKLSVGESRLLSTLIANGFTVPFGWLPAEKLRKYWRPSLRRIDSARIERALLPVHRKRTL